MEYNHNYYYYNCYVNIQNQFTYKLIDENEEFFLPDDYTGKIIQVDKNIPLVCHRMILYWKFIPSFFQWT